jgi:ribose transport system permease protein
MTLGMQYIAKGVVYVLTKGAPIYPLPKEFLALDKMRFFGLPSIVCIAFVFAIGFYIMASQTRLGREMYAVGGNRNAARLSGISADKVIIIAYILTAALSVFTGIAMAARVGSAQSTSGVGYELNAIVACLIGGTSILGGSGNVPGTVIGAIFIQVLQNGLLMLHVSVYWQQLIIGVVVVLAVVWDQYKRMLQARKL